MAFFDLVGFHDSKGSYADAKNRLEHTDGEIVCPENGKSYGVGVFELVSLTELRERVGKVSKDVPSANEKVFPQIRDNKPEKEDVKNYLRSKEYNGALFQVASQFNLLEMQDTNSTPEDGVEIYWHDHTQGPACAQATIGATLYRNYFIKNGSQKGQTAFQQVNCLNDVLSALNMEQNIDYQYENGYICLTKNQFSVVNGAINKLSVQQRNDVMGLLKLGIHWNAQVNNESKPMNQRVSLILCSALPLGHYARPGVSLSDAEHLAQIILDGTQEATFLAGILNKKLHSGSDKIVLTKVGGGVFGNPHEWIVNARYRSQCMFNENLDILQYHYNTMEKEYSLKKVQVRNDS